MEFRFGVHQFNSFFTLSPEMMAVLSSDGLFLEVNPAWEKNLGFTPRELKDSPFFELLPPSGQSQAQLEIRKLQEGEKTVSFDSQCFRKDRSCRWVRWNWSRADQGDVFCLTGRDVTELKEVQKDLEENREKFKRLAESATEGVALHDKGIILEANQALARMFGFEKAEEIVGKNGLDFAAPEYKQLILNNIQAGTEEPYEVVGVRKDQSRFNCLLSGKTIPYQGRMVRVSTFLDISKAKDREQELFESQELFRKLAEAAKDGIAVSEKGKILMANPALARMFGVEVSEMIGRNAVEYTAPEFRETLLKRVLEEVETSYEVMGIRKDGSRFPVEITPRMTTYHGRKVRVAFFRDITRRKRIEEEIHREKEFSQSLINSSVDGLLAFDHECRYTLWNPAMERISGHSREECLGKCAFDVFPFLKQIGEDKFFYEALAGRTASTQERPYRTPAGKQGFFEAQYMPIKNVKGEILGGLGVIHDITERKKAEEALRISELNLKAVFNNTFQNIVLLDLSGQIRAFNANAAVAFRDNSGKDLQIGKHLFEYVQQGHQPMVEKYLARARKGEVTHLEQPFVMGDGQEHWFEVKYHPVFEDLGEIEGICLTSLDINDRKKTEETVQKSEADLRAVFNSSRQYIILAGKDGRIRDFSENSVRGFREALGMDLQKDHLLEEYVEPAHVKAFRDRFKKAMKGEVIQIERPVRGLDGQDRWHEFTYNPVFDRKGKTIGVCVAIASIEQRKQAEQALKESEEKFRRVVEDAPMGVTLVDNELRFTFVNRAYCRMLGYSEEELLSRSIKDITHPDDLSQNLVQALRLPQTGSFKLQKRYLHKNGHIVWGSLVANAFFNAQGEMLYSMGIVENITEKLAAEMALRESEERFRKIFEDAPVGMAMVQDQHLTKVNLALCEMLGYASSELVGKDFRDITHPEDLNESQAPLEENKDFHYQKRYLRKDGEIVWADVSGTAVMDGNGQRLYSLIVVENITERKRAQEGLQRSEADLKAVFNSGSQVTILIGPDGKVQRFNLGAEIMSQRVLGIKMTEGISFLSTLPPGASPEMYEKSFQAALDGKETQGERAVQPGNGPTRWVEVKYQPVRNAQGNVQGVCFSMTFIDDRKRAEEALRHSESNLRAVFNSSPQVIILLDLEGRVQAFNKAAAAAGRKMLDVVVEAGRSLLDYVPEGSRETYLENFTSALKGKTVHGERPFRGADGLERWVEVTYQPVFNDKGEVEGICYVSNSIDERKESEKTLRENQERFERFAQVTREGILIHESPKVVDVNLALAAMMGYEPVEMIGKSGFDFIAPESREFSKGQMIQGSTEPYEVLALRKDGSKFPIELHGMNYKYKDRTLRVMSVRDLTWRKEAERTLIESEERYRRLVEFSPMALLVHREGKILFLNPEGLKLLAADRSEQVIGKPLLEIVHPDYREMVNSQIRRAEETSSKNDPMEQKLVRLDGQVIDVEVQGIPFTYEGKPSRLAMIRDVTESRKIQEMLLRYERLAAVGKVIAGIAHEIRTPLGVVSGMGQILRSKMESRSQYSQELDTILTQTNRLKLFMNDILDYSKEMEIHKRTVEPRRLLEQALALAQTQAGPSHVDILVEWAMEKDLPVLLVDPDRLEQVLVNLILNAYQAMSGKGKLKLVGWTKDGWMALGVGDNGPGIPSADLPRLFEPFFTTKRQGSGLGLPISRKIVEAHGGHIDVEKGSAQGTRFMVYLPLKNTVKKG